MCCRYGLKVCKHWTQSNAFHMVYHIYGQANMPAAIMILSLFAFLLISSILIISRWFPCVVDKKDHHISYFNSLRPSDAIWRQWFWTTLAQVMACCLTAPSHYLNQCWLIIRGVLWHTSESSFAGIAQGIDSGYEFEKDILKNIFKSPRGQWVKLHVKFCSLIQIKVTLSWWFNMKTVISHSIYIKWGGNTYNICHSIRCDMPFIVLMHRISHNTTQFKIILHTSTAMSEAKHKSSFEFTKIHPIPCPHCTVGYLLWVFGKIFTVLWPHH